jgi:hypothetical protein
MVAKSQSPVDGWLRNPKHQLIDGKHPIICLGFNHTCGGAGFRNHPQYDVT